ncbi:glycosyltransferase family 2 protein [Microbacterium sp. SLBN-146]|uniref:glycosyltransferase n=1 Tax=Microbacterium sp. SLBN-146 TaxID=2768457 RepID=UPI0011532AC9|nr:glycosyltransferase [Microbacterium sp. SLBN-146]TQJ31151.1 glycosyl transferase family 2 [Microbacterium sp. SLBN-146]
MRRPHVAVVIPVHDESDLLARCLRSVVAAADAARHRARTSIVVVLDDCSDDSAQIAARFPVTTLTIGAGRVGAARRAGVEWALARFPLAQDAGIWLAHTDADSVVPAHWLTHQLDLMDAGAGLVIGTVRPDFADLTPAHRAQWLATHHRGRPNGHVHGANLGILAEVYRAAGGFPDVAEHEDVLLVQEAVRAGAAVVASDDAEVETSGRLVGRTPGGYAGHLRAQADAITSQPA